MKAKVIIENGETAIILTPDNEFETDVMEKLYCKKEAHDLKTSVYATYNYGAYTHHNIQILIKEIGKN